MATIVTRAGKGSPLTHEEVDSNFVNLNTDKAEASAYVALNGDTMTGALVLPSDPTSNLEAATKQYVDTIAAAGIHYHDPVRVESPSALTVTYDNGTSGVGATLTNAGAQAAISIDGITLDLADRVLVYNQVNAAQNGVYTVTNLGSGSTNWVLTRSTDADSYAPSSPTSLGQGDAFFVLSGNTGAGELYVCNTVGTITFGTTNIMFSQIASTAVYSAGTGLALTGTVFSNTITNNNQLTNGSAYITSSESISGNAATATTAAACTGNALTATTLQTARTIGGVSFDGSININLAGVNATGNQNTTGNAATATNATTAASCSGNAATATVLQTARTINGVSFNGSANITVADSTKLPLAGGALTGSVTLSGDNYTTYGPNSNWGAYLRVGGNGRTATATNMASIATSNGNIHIDAGSAAGLGTYINYFAGDSGIYFGNGASGVIGSINSSGNLTMSTSVNAPTINTTSDATLKTNVKTLTGSLDAVQALRGVSFDWIENGGSDIGVIAQEVEAVLPALVSTNDKGIKSVKYGNMVAVLIEAVKELKAEIEELKKR